jgi:hypothetical protein
MGAGTTTRATVEVHESNVLHDLRNAFDAEQLLTTAEPRVPTRQTRHSEASELRDG